MNIHTPVLLKEVVNVLNPQKNQNFIDATFGGGGHSKELLKHNGPNGQIIGIEWDEYLYQKAQHEYQKEKRIKIIGGNYAEILKNWNRYRAFKNLKIHGILFDLGMSSWHIEHSGRGFSFRKNEPLDMRYNATKSKIRNQKSEILTAEKIINTYPREELEKILREYGEERFAGRIAAAIEKTRAHKRIATTKQLADAVTRAVPQWYCRRKIDCATKTFQALRITTNRELFNLEHALSSAARILTTKGRIAVISFHSLEDRIVKNYFKKNKTSLRIITKMPIMAEQKEIQNNPRSRSAKLRAAELIS